MSSGSDVLDEVRELPATAHALTAFRALSNGSGRMYTAVTFGPDPRKGCQFYLRRFAAVGAIKSASNGPETPYAVLDVVDSDGDIISDFEITNAKHFRYVYQQLGLRVETLAS